MSPWRGRFWVHPGGGARLLASHCLGGVACYLAGRLMAACTRSPTKGTTWVLRACFMVFPLSMSAAMCTPTLSKGLLSIGMAVRISPLKILPRSCPHWYRALPNGVMVVATMMMSEPSSCHLCFFLRAKNNHLSV